VARICGWGKVWISNARNRVITYYFWLAQGLGQGLGQGLPHMMNEVTFDQREFTIPLLICEGFHACNKWVVWSVYLPNYSWYPPWLCERNLGEFDLWNDHILERCVWCVGVWPHCWLTRCTMNALSSKIWVATNVGSLVVLNGLFKGRFTMPCCWISCSKRRRGRRSPVAMLKPIYSLSVVLNAISVCSLLTQCMGQLQYVIGLQGTSIGRRSPRVCRTPYKSGLLFSPF
jgi:hypothetical protein